MGGIVRGWKSDERHSEESLPDLCTDPWEPRHIWTSVAPGKSEQIQFQFAWKKKNPVNLKIWFCSVLQPCTSRTWDNAKIEHEYCDSCFKSVA